jgi:diguanylate cyclase (GGDEF)-like protein/PAS domain S-box-containing protein
MSSMTQKNSLSSTSSELVLQESKPLVIHSRDYLARLTDFLPDIIYIYHLPLQKTLFINKSFTTILGYPREMILNGEISWYDIIHPTDQADAPKVFSQIMHLADHATIEYEFRCKPKDKDYIWLHNKLTVFSRDYEGKPEQTLVTSHDITYRKNLESKLLLQAYTDQLTGIANRTVFMETLDGMILSGCEKYVVMFIDLNEFKSINDTYGHEIGDKVIVETANRLSLAMPAPNMIARLGGDEFTVIIRDCDDKKTLARYTQKIQAQFKKPMNFGKIKLNIHVSMGSVFAGNVENPTTSKLLKLADQAMYTAKKKFYVEKSQLV